MKARITLFIALLFFSFGYASGQSMHRDRTIKPDFQPNCLCLLTNGDRVSGYVLGITPVAISMETAYAGVLTIPPASILSCETSDAELRLRIKNFLSRNVESSPTIPTAPISTSEESSTKDSPSDKKTENPWKRNLEFGYTYSRGNANITDMDFSGGISRTGKKDKLSLDSLMRKGAQDGTETANLFTLTARHDRKIADEQPIFGYMSFFNEMRYETDQLKRLDHRLAWSGGITKSLFKRRENALVLDLGGGVTKEKYFTDGNRFVGSGLLRLSSEQTFFTGTTFKQEMEMIPDFGEFGRYLLQTNLSLKAPLSKSLSLKFGALNRFDSSPQENVKRNDFSVLSGLAIEF
jgi:putative salt-induced outer membrane protein YdiY